MQGFSHVTEDSCSASGSSSSPAVSRASAEPTEDKIRAWGSLEDNPRLPFHHGRMGGKEKPLSLPRSSELQTHWREGESTKERFVIEFLFILVQG